MRATQRTRHEAKQLLRLCRPTGSLDEGRVRLVARAVGQATSRSRFAILADFRRLVRLDCARHAATVESAVPMPPDLRADVQTRLAQRYGPGLSVSFAHRPALIGGTRIQVAGDVYDGSVRAGLDALEAAF